jgi:hypothetical protein
MGVVDGGGYVMRGCVGVVGLALVCSLLLCLEGGAWAGDLQVVINEVLYDPDGSDTGYEFVELFNRGEACVCLEGWTFETGNGGYRERWKLEWRGTKAESIGPHGFFVIGEDRVVPEPDFVASLDLQNGPDGCRLRDPVGGTDVVGWGQLDFEEYFEGAPVEDVKSGSSIGRDPDGSDSDLNRADFRALAIPSPADHNRPPTDLVTKAVGLSRYTPLTSPEIDLVCRIHNAGTEACGRLAGLTAEVNGFRDSVLIPEDIDPAATIGIVVRLPNPGAGIYRAAAWHSYEGDRWKGNDTAQTSIVVPPPPVVVNEIMFKSGGQDCEWVELYNHSDRKVSLRGWTLEDSRAKPGAIAEGDLVIAGGEFLVLVEDTDLFEALHPDVPRQGYRRPSGGWPTLNDIDGPLRFADAVVIRDGFGTMVDSVAYSQNWCAPGRSVERVDPSAATPDPANWSPHFGSSPSSPGGPNSVSFHLPTGGRVLSLSPRTFSPDGDGKDDLLAVSMTLPGPGLARLCVFDINGRLVRRLIDGEVIDSGRVTFWDGTYDGGSGAATGVYLLLFEARMRSSGKTFRARSPIVLIRR